MSAMSSRDPESEEALFPRRIVSFVLDSIAVQVIALIYVNSPLGFHTQYVFEMGVDEVDLSLLYLFLLWLLYLWFFDLVCYGASPGKMAFKLRTRQPDASQLPRYKHFFRTLIKMLSVCLVLPGLYFMYTRKALHDRVYHTKTFNAPSLEPNSSMIN